MKNILASVLSYKSKEIPWVTGGRGDATFDGSFIPERGPNGGVLVIDRFVAHGSLSITVADAALQGEDIYKAFRKVTLTQQDGEQRYSELKGDSLRIVSYAFEGGDSTHEHQDIAISGPVTVSISAAIPLSKPYDFEPDDTALPSYMFNELKIGMAQDADLSTGAPTVTVHSGSYWVIAECHEEMAAVHHAVDTIFEQDFDTAASGTLSVNGRLQDLFLFVRGVNGGASLANLTSATIPTENILPVSMLRTPDLSQSYARKRGGATNLFSTKGNPLRTDPFVASDTGTMRAVAVLLSQGNKVWEGPDVKNVMVKTELAGALSLTMIARATKRKSRAAAQLVQKKHSVNASYIKTAGKTRRNHTQWSPDQAAYLPEKYFNVDGNGRELPTKLFSGPR